LLARGAFVAVSTHLPALKVFGSNSEHVVSAAMGFNEESLAPTYKLLIGVPGQSAGLAMARRFGMPDELIERAREVQGRSSEDASKFLSELHRRVDEYAEDERELRSRELALIAREEKLERDASSKAKLAKEQAQRRIEELTQGFERRYREALKEALDNIQAGAKSTRAAERSVAKSRGALRREMEQVVRAELGDDATVSGGLEDELTVGTRVRVGSMGASGTITRKLAGERWEVQVGQLKMQVSTDDISFVETGPEPVSKLPAGVTYEPATRSSVLPSEINVIGKTADEARDVVDKYLDEAVLAEMPRVRIIHGFGQNILRRELSKMFRGHVHVAKHYDAELHEGGSGATIVEIRT
jgi:DNA mismatch repair protein MutS2